MASFASTQAQRRKMIDLLVSFFNGLDHSFVDKVVTYAECLKSPDNQEISTNTFIYEMMFRFNLTSSYMISLIFNNINRHRKGTNKSVTIEQYSRLICTFMTSDLDNKINFIFNVYDLDRDGFLSKLEVNAMLMTTFPQSDEEQDEMLKDLIEIMLKVVDRDGSGTIDEDEFRVLVKKDVLYLELLGQVLPDDRSIQKFKNSFLNKTKLEIKDFFASEKAKNAIGLPDFRKDEMYFPVKLECA